MTDKSFYIHLISDATGTTLLGLARAALAQFDEIEPKQKFWPLVRTKGQLEKILAEIDQTPGPVIFTLVDKDLRERLQERCDYLGVPCVSVLDPIIKGLSSHLGLDAKRVPGLQHIMDDAYFKRVEAIDFAMRYDDGKSLKGIAEADVVLVGVSRTSKTPTAIFLARRGVKCANIPLVPGVQQPEESFTQTKPLYIGLTASPKRLGVIRKSRLGVDDADMARREILNENEYLDLEKIEEETRRARKLFAKHGWPVIDVSKRSIEETAAEILSMLSRNVGGHHAEFE